MNKNDLRNQKGFTLIEVMCVIVILGVLTSTTIHKYGLLTDTAEINSLTAGIRELNIRESLTWIQLKLDKAGWPGDVKIFNEVDKNLGSGYRWDPKPPPITGSALHFKTQSASLSRTPSTIGSPAVWR